MTDSTKDNDLPVMPPAGKPTSVLEIEERKQAIFSIEDRSLRQRAIAENIDLFENHCDKPRR